MLDLFGTPWQVFLICVAVLLLVAEIGFRLARRRRPTTDDAVRGHVATVQGAVFGLLALLLAFTFAMAVQRFDVRKQLVLDEANAIGTTYLRADFLAEPLRAEIKRELRGYVDARLEFFAAGRDQRQLKDALTRAGGLQAHIWSSTVAAAPEARTPVTFGLFVSSLNEMIDLNAKRLAALENTVPTTVWALLACIAVLAIFTNGYATGLSSARIGLSMLVIPLVTAAVTTVCIDLDRPRQGLIQVSQASMEELRATLTP